MAEEASVNTSSRNGNFVQMDGNFLPNGWKGKCGVPPAVGTENVDFVRLFQKNSI